MKEKKKELDNVTHAAIKQLSAKEEPWETLEVGNVEHGVVVVVQAMHRG